MGADAGIYIRVEGSENEEAVYVPNIGSGDDIYFFIKEGLSHKLQTNLDLTTWQKIKNYGLVEDKNSPMLEEDPEVPDYRNPYEIRQIAELIRRDILLKLKNKELEISPTNTLQFFNLITLLGGIIGACNYAENLNQKIALVYTWE